MSSTWCGLSWTRRCEGRHFPDYADLDAEWASLGSRGAIVKAMAICTRHSFIEIFKVSSQVSVKTSF